MKRNVYVGVLLTALLMTSCINTKRIVYLEDMKESLSYPMNAQPEMKIQRDDRLSIVVSSRNPELTVPFNISLPVEMKLPVPICKNVKKGIW